MATSASSRRRFLASATTVTAGVALSPQIAAAAERRRPYRESKRVDMHAHHLAPDYLAALHGAGIYSGGGLPFPEWSPELAIEFMDSYGIALQMISTSDPGVDFLTDPAQAAQIARDTNDWLAELMAQYPKRFGGLGVVSLQDPDAARAEAARCLDELHLDGLGLLASSKGRYLGDPAFDGLHSALNDRGAWVFVHPVGVGADDKPSYSVPDFVAEFPFETTRTIASLLFNGVFARYRNIRWHFAHGGGTIPMHRARLRVLAANSELAVAALGLPSGSKGLTAESPIRALRRSFFDTALIADPPPLEAVRAMTKVDGMVFGTDWPFSSRTFTEPGDPAPALSKVFDNGDRRAIDRLNALREFRRLRKFIPKS